MAAYIEIIEVAERTPALIGQLVEVWERSVRATHAFLADADVTRIKRYVPEAIAQVGRLFVAVEQTSAADGSAAPGVCEPQVAPAAPVAFMGIEGERLEMLFVDPDYRGRGVGKALLLHGIGECGVRELTVNEQNPQAVGFYEHMGFATHRRTDADEQGDPYPLLYMRLA